ncbi:MULTISPECIES: STAS/SEC14 domain-containing protein [Ramlibacter]|uniref:STAS/SEC14 domain-containing protein n=1 Tax=Ramlibacter aquaticus TaxID=2780094 RepID=A0ABR9SKC8_9BURK|nr:MULTISPECIES: STAS/SEC14 domain-containing protein [Ramlibacter]MBE7942777.1 hypothetical protein [Ramlibacter aquaticus]
MTHDGNLPFALSRDAIRVELALRDGFLDATVSGFKSPEGAMAVLARIAQALRDARQSRVLIDVTAVIGQMSGSDHAALGAALAAQFGPVRCAVVARADRPRGEIGPAASAGGVNYQAFDDREAALQWLVVTEPR